MSNEKDAAELLAHIEACYQPTHRYEPVDARQFRHLDLSFYQKTESCFAHEGFAILGDQEDVTLRDTPGNLFRRIMIRNMVSSNGDICAGFYHAKIRFWWSMFLFLLGVRGGKYIDLETEFSDGAFVVTSNAMIAASVKLPPTIYADYLPTSTPAAELLRIHRLRMEIYTSVNKTAHPRPARTLPDVIAMQNRQHAIKAAYRNEIGGITLDELNAHTDWSGRSDIIKLYEEMQRQRKVRKSSL